MSLIDPILSAAAAKAAGYKDPANPKDATEYPNAIAASFIPTEDEKNVRSQIVKYMTQGWTAQYKPRVEFNDLSLVQTSMEDLMAFNTYQPNDGDWPEGDQNSWRSTAIRPIERNKVMSMAGHVSGRLGFVKLTALSAGSEPQEEASEVINSLMDFVRGEYFPPQTLLEIILPGLYAPKALIFTEYNEVYRAQKTERDAQGKWKYQHRLDESMSGFVSTVIPPNQLYFENFFERDIQKQGWIVWRRVQSHDTLKAKYGTWKNWEGVQKGMQLVLTDPNANFYYVYDPELWGEMGEEIIMWRKEGGGCKVHMVNGVVIGEWDAKNPREDGLFPLWTLGYQMIRTDFFWDKSLVSCVKQDAKVLNTLYPLMIDGTVLSTIPPTFATGTEIIGSDVIIPGMTTTLKDKDAQLRPIMEPPNISQAITALGEIEKSLDDTVNTQAVPNNQPGITAYQISAIEAQQEQAIGPFRDSLLSSSMQLTRLVLGDVLQHFTIVDADNITGDAPLVYKTFLANNKRIKFTDMPNVKTKADVLNESYNALDEQGGKDASVPLYKVNPAAFRQLRFKMIMSPDILMPKSENVRFQNNLETFDKGIAAKQAGANVDLDKMFEDFVLTTNEKSARNPDKYMMGQGNGMALGQNPMAALPGAMGAKPPGQPPMPPGPMQGKPAAPVQAPMPQIAPAMPQVPQRR